MCAYCLKPIEQGQDRATLDGRDYHSSCYDRQQAHERSRTKGLDLTAVKAKLAAGVLPQAGDVDVRFARFGLSGACLGCDAAFGSGDVGVQVDGGRRFLHVDCYVMWTEACAD